MYHQIGTVVLEIIIYINFRTNTNEDIGNRLYIDSDPVIVAMKKKPKRKHTDLTPQMKSLLILDDSDDEDSEDDSDNDDSEDDSENDNSENSNDK